METITLTIMVPTLDILFGWFVFYIWLGVIAVTSIGVFSVWKHYGNTVGNVMHPLESVIVHFLVTITWPVVVYCFIRDKEWK